MTTGRINILQEIRGLHFLNPSLTDGVYPVFEQVARMPDQEALKFSRQRYQEMKRESHLGGPGAHLESLGRAYMKFHYALAAYSVENGDPTIPVERIRDAFDFFKHKNESTLLITGLADGLLDQTSFRERPLLGKER